MARAIVLSTVFTSLFVFSGVADARSWIIENYELQDFSGGVRVTGGGYNGADYYYASGWHGQRRAYWKFDFPDAPSRPAMYFIEQWVPSLPAGVTNWSWLPIEVNFSGRDGEPWPYNNSIPWIGDDLTPPYNGQNHQWVGMTPDLINAFKTATATHAPINTQCNAPSSGTGALGMVWMRKGSWMYTKWDFSFLPSTAAHPVTALRITEVNPPPDPACDTATLGGPIDLRCMGNTDPLYAGSEYYGSGPEASVDGNSLGAEGYAAPNCFTTNTPLNPGLAASGLYTAQLPTGNVGFQLRFDGMNSLKWRDDDAGTYARSNTYVLNDVAGREFVEAKYARLYLLTVKGGGTNSQLSVEAVYDDNTTELSQVNLYDWFNQDGDDASLAVGADGQPRRASTDFVGFRRLNSDGTSGNGGDHGGAFPLVQTIALNKSKILKQIRLAIADQATFDGELCVLGATLELGCNSPVFDVVGASGDPADPDGDVDQQDFAWFQRCYTTDVPGNLFDRSLCGCLDWDGDQDVDADDLAIFEKCASGPGVPADPSCDGR